MANWTKATLATRTLEHMGLVGTGQTPNSTMQSRMEEVIDSVYPLLRKRGLAPYLTSAVEEPYQQPMVKYLAYQAAPRFGFRGAALQDYRIGAVEAEREMYMAASAYNHGQPTMVDWV